MEVRSEEKAELIKGAHRELLRWLDQNDDYPDEFRASNLGITNERMSFNVLGA